MKNTIRLFWLITTIVLVYSCSTAKSAKEVSYQILTDSAYQGKKQQSYEVIDNENNLKELYRTVKDNQIPDVDFSKSRIVALFMGEKNTGGYSIGIDEIKTEKEKVIIKVKKTYPEGMATMAFSQPYMIAKINTTKKIEFTE
ncbi:MAG: protease complex subunit PrcB family protein [Flavobacteriaceae bacterium]